MGVGMMRRHRDAAAKKAKEAAEKKAEEVTGEQQAEGETQDAQVGVDLHKMTKKELIALAEEKGVEVDESMKKDELIEALSKGG